MILGQSSLIVIVFNINYDCRPLSTKLVTIITCELLNYLTEPLKVYSLFLNIITTKSFRPLDITIVIHHVYCLIERLTPLHWHQCRGWRVHVVSSPASDQKLVKRAVDPPGPLEHPGGGLHQPQIAQGEAMLDNSSGTTARATGNSTEPEPQGIHCSLTGGRH